MCYCSVEPWVYTSNSRKISRDLSSCSLISLAICTSVCFCFFSCLETSAAAPARERIKIRMMAMSSEDIILRIMIFDYVEKFVDNGVLFFEQFIHINNNTEKNSDYWSKF